jgi:hypothetical protein
MLPLELTIHLENDDSLADPRPWASRKDPLSENESIKAEAAA